MKATVNIGLLGLGNVGTGVLNILTHNADLLCRRTGKKLMVRKILVKDLSKQRGLKMPGIHLTDRADDILDDADIHIVVEAMGGEFPAYDYIKKALKNKKFVVTANKEVVSKHKKEFFELAKKNKVDIYFEASVGGGIPLIRSLKVGYAANKIQTLYGILNGTSNYILTQIEEKQEEFDDALNDAKKMGFAEADPTMDISGLDTAYKLTILAAVAFKMDITVNDLSYEGIQDISLKDIVYAKELGYRIKLLAIAHLLDKEEINFRVHPTMILLDHPLAAVRNELNAVFLVGDAVGESMLSGKGAGASPTGSAIVSDIIDIAFDTKIGRFYDTQGKAHVSIEGVDDPLYINKRNLEDELHQPSLVNICDIYSQFYLRLAISDSPGALARITTVFGENEVSISKILQKNTVGLDAEVVVITYHTKEEYLRKSVQVLTTLSVVKHVYSVIHVGF